MTTPPPQSLLTIACIQMRPEIGEIQANVAHSLQLIRRAHQQGAQLIVLPELCNSGYMFASRSEAFALSETIDGETVQAWLAIAKELDITLVAGFTERDGDQLFNSAALVGPDGLIGCYRKLHLWGEENLFFERGNLQVPVFSTPFGRIACAICYDMWFPEVMRLAALQGADILCVPTNWVPMANQPVDQPVMANILAMAGAHSNSMFIAAADRVGIERGQPFLGSSIIVGCEGWPLAGPASINDEEILIAQVNLSDARKSRQFNAYNHVLHDRRTDFYQDMLGTTLVRGPG
ncbi:MAG: N-carbamoylputrescine amidase [Burkholderiaceae bacterium]|jgi:predicted amidohydrolase